MSVLVNRIVPVFLLCFGLASSLMAANRGKRDVSGDPNDVKRQNFSFDTRLRYNSALVNGVKSLNVLVAARMGHTEEAISGFDSCGGRVGYRFDPVGYFWGSIPTDDFPKLLAVQDIVDLELDGPTNSGVDYIEPSDPAKLRPASVWSRQKALKPPDESVAKLPLLPPEKLEGKNPYLPWYLMDVPEFLTEHPTYDGRGTTIAVVEGYGDLLHPVLQDALTLDGRPISKIAGILDMSSEADAFYDRGRGYYPPALRLKMSDEVLTRTNRVEYEGIAFTLPAPGKYKIAHLENGGRSFWVVWSPERSSVWVDTNQNNNFADEVELKDINEQFSASQIPAESGLPTQVLARPTTFAIKIDETNSSISFYLNLDDHGTGVASIAAGKGFLGGNGGGVATGARVLFVMNGGGSLHGSLKAFIGAASRDDVDVVTCSFVIKPMISGETVTALILDRLALVYKKPMFFTVTAGPTATTDNISDQGTGPHVFGVMGYTNPEIWHQFYGVDVPLRDNDPDGGGNGPAINGAIKPDFVTPFHQLSAGNCTRTAFEAEHRSTVVGYRLPDCYVEFGGTSGSTPEAAGLAALIISGAKQAGLKYDLDRLAWALRSSASFLDQTTEPVGYQGYGLPSASLAWKLFSGGETTPDFRITAESNGPHEAARKTPHAGIGIYEYGGWRPGMRGERTVTVTRLSGGKEPRDYLLVWRGNDGTFVAPSSLSLSLDKPVSVQIKVAPAISGIHQAILQIVDSESGATLNSFLNTVVASESLDNKEHMAKWERTIPLSHEACAMFEVPLGTNAIAADIDVRGGPALLWTGPSASQGEQNFVSYYLVNRYQRTASFKEEGSKHIVFSRPAAGPWAFCLRNHQGAGDPQGNHVAYIKATVEISALGVEIKPQRVRFHEMRAGSPTLAGFVRLTNVGAALRRVAISTRVGFEDSHVVDLRTAGQTSEFMVQTADATTALSFAFAAPLSNFGVSIYACAPDINRGNAVRCALQDNRENPSVLEYRVLKARMWKIVLFSTGTPDMPPSPIRVKVTQSSSESSLISPTRGDAIEVLGKLETRADQLVPINVDLNVNRHGERQVLIADVYDLGGTEEQAMPSKSVQQLHAEEMNPVVLGRAVLQVAPSTSDTAGVVVSK